MLKARAPPARLGACGKKKNRVLKKNVYQKEMYAKGPRTTSSAWRLR
jgi:hypothetical protein